jgi:hypothetical protein
MLVVAVLIVVVAVVRLVVVDATAVVVEALTVVDTDEEQAAQRHCPQSVIATQSPCLSISSIETDREVFWN